MFGDFYVSLGCSEFIRERGRCVYGFLWVGGYKLMLVYGERC